MGRQLWTDDERHARHDDEDDPGRLLLSLLIAVTFVVALAMVALRGWP